MFFHTTDTSGQCGKRRRNILEFLCLFMSIFKAQERAFYIFMHILGPKMLTCSHIVHYLSLCTHFMGHGANRKKHLKSNLTKQSNHILIGFVVV